jgi:hypothetical protein
VVKELKDGEGPMMEELKDGGVRIRSGREKGSWFRAEGWRAEGGGEAKGWRRRSWRCGEVKGVEVGSGNCGGGS